MDAILIIANVLSLTGNVLFTLSALLKSKRKILLFQSSNHTLAIVAEVMMNAYSAMAQEAVSLTRNMILLFLKIKNDLIKLILNIICIIVALTLGILFNILFSDGVWYGYLPVFGTLIYSVSVVIAFMVKASSLNCEAVIKIGLSINSVAWGVYGFFVDLYPIMIFNALNFIFSIISIVRIVILFKKVRVNEALNNEEQIEENTLEND